jgi:murein DD-endopeptidase MepM/ murein hydrolase activator NlpD
MYTTAGFVVLGGVGAAWSHRPVAIDTAAANPFDGAQLAEQFVEITALDTPIWAQRLVADLRTNPSVSDATQVAAANLDTPTTIAPKAKPDWKDEGTAGNAAKPILSASSIEVAQLPAALTVTPAYRITAAQTTAPAPAETLGAEISKPAQEAIIATATAPFTARIFTAPEFHAPNISIAPYSNPVPVELAAVEPAMVETTPHLAVPPFGFAWNPIENPDDSIAEQVAQDIEKVIEVRPGDTLYGVLVDAGVTEDEAKDAVGALSDVFSPRDLRAGQEITLNISTASGTRDTNADPQLVRLSFEPDVVTDVTLTRDTSGDFIAASVDKELVDANRRAAGVINSSLFDAAQEAGVPMPVVADLIKTFSFDVDFQRDIQDGDAFEIVYERKETEAGDFVKSGQILFASLTLSGKTIPVYYFERDGEGEYFTPKGEAIRKSLLRTPIDGARITSGFGMRMHPVLGFSKMHKGVDFGAPTGTPIFAAGSGTVVEVGKKGAYGNYVRIRHNGEYQTAYAHMSKFAKGIKKGDKVKQGDVIGYVGATGRVTGPHLHYEVLINGEQANPGKVKMASADKLTGKQLKAFEAQMAKIDAERKRQADQQLIAETPGDANLSCGIEEGCQN